MSLVRLAPAGPEQLAAEIRALAPVAASVTATVEEIVRAVRDGGQTALQEHAERLDGLPKGTAIRVPRDELDAALADLDPLLRSSLEQARANIAAVASATTGEDRTVEIGSGHRVTMREVAVGRAGIYAPGGRNPYPSTVLMGAVTARAAGVEEVVVCVPGGHPVMLAACALCGDCEVWRVGGAHAIAALAYGTEELRPVDVVAGPGNLYVQEAKRLLAGASFGVDGFAGPSDLLVLAGSGSDPAIVAADLLAQAEHGVGSVVALVSPDPQLLEAVAGEIEGVETGGAVALGRVSGADEALAVAEAFAPEHLELVGAEMEALATRVTRAGCVFVGAATGVAFGDYIAGANHTLPTAGAARFASVLSARSFRRLMSVVELSGEAAAGLAAPAIAIAEAEGFTRHAASLRLRQNHGT
ncbi:MAG: histidinol dehydrogenase [Baekduia sp.]